MAFSYSFHLSAKSHSVSSCGKVSQVGKHNLREYESADYDRTKIDVMIGNGSMLDMVKECYHREFDEALAEYNQGKRADRQIQDYLDHVDRSRSDVAAEVIIQIGDKEFWENKTDTEKQSMKEVFKDQLRTLHRECPDFKIVSAVAHYDESSPHVHVVGVPIARGYKKGMAVQCAKTKVFTQETLSHLQDVMRANAEKHVSSMPLFQGMELKAKEKGRNKDIPKESLAEFYELENQIQEKSKFLEVQEDRLVAVRDDISLLQQEGREIRKDNFQLKYESQALKKSVDSMRTEAEDSRGELARLKAEETELKSQVVELRQEKGQLQGEINSYKSSLSKWQDTISKKQEEVSVLHERVVKQSQLIDRQQNTMQSNQGIIKEQERQIEERKGILSTLEKRLDSLKTEISAMWEKITLNFKTGIEKALREPEPQAHDTLNRATSQAIHEINLPEESQELKPDFEDIRNRLLRGEELYIKAKGQPIRKLSGAEDSFRLKYECAFAEQGKAKIFKNGGITDQHLNEQAKNVVRDTAEKVDQAIRKRGIHR